MQALLCIYRVVPIDSFVDTLFIILYEYHLIGTHMVNQ